MINFDRSSSTATTDGLAAVGSRGGEEGAGGGAGGWRQLHRHLHHYRRHHYHCYPHHQANEVSLIIVVIAIINIKPTSQIINSLPRKRQLACAGADGGGRRQSCRHTNPRIALVDTSASLFEVIIVNNSTVLMIEIFCGVTGSFHPPQRSSPPPSTTETSRHRRDNLIIEIEIEILVFLIARLLVSLLRLPFFPLLCTSLR